VKLTPGVNSNKFCFIHLLTFAVFLSVCSTVKMLLTRNGQAKWQKKIKKICSKEEKSLVELAPVLEMFRLLEE